MLTTGQLIGLMALAYMFSFGLRLIWVWQFNETPSFMWDEQLMINTNDGYLFATLAREELLNTFGEHARLPDLFKHALVILTIILVKITPFSLETIILYLPAVISSIVVVPVILIANMYQKPIWGFFAALLGSVGWSYYNRTMIGYYDTDMFSAMAPMFILYFLMKSTIDFNVRSALFAALAISIYPFLYDSGQALVYAMGVIYAIYMVYYHINEQITYYSLILVFVALLPISIPIPFVYFVKIILLFGIYILVNKVSFEQKKLLISTGLLFIIFIYFSDAFGLILRKVIGYTSTGTALDGLHFYSVKQTVREAGQIPFEMFANRISGSQWGLLLAMVGYVLLVVKHRAFILALPLVGIGIFALWGGLRFTVYAVPIAALSAIYLLFVLGSYLNNKKLKYMFIVLATAGMLYPNIIHIIDYKVPTVLNKSEVQDLEKLQMISDPKDYTLTWWDYGYPIWFYSHTNTLIDGGKHNNDNFIISKILQTSSPQLAANLSRLAVETYVNSDYKVVADTLFKNKQEDQLDPNILLAELESRDYKVPEKTRDIYLYLPYRMLQIFPTVALFGNLNLNTGKKERKISFYPTQAVNNQNGLLQFRNGISFDSKKGEISLGGERQAVKYFIATQNTKQGDVQLQSQLYHVDGEAAVVYLKSYGQFVIMDMQTFNSTYVQMFMLGKYDKRLFELVVSSPYSKIYKLKI